MGRFIEDFPVGEVYRSRGRTIAESDLVQFTGLSWDTNPAHTDEEFGKTTPFGTRIAHGALTLSYATGLLACSGWFDNTAIAFLGIEKWAFTGAVMIGDTIALRATTLEARVRSVGGRHRGPRRGESGPETRRRRGRVVFHTHEGARLGAGGMTPDPAFALLGERSQWSLPRVARRQAARYGDRTFITFDVAGTQQELSARGIDFLDAAPRRQRFLVSDFTGKPFDEECAFAFSRPHRCSA